ncbi:DNA damage-regulated autophagy modulator protein 2-like [Patiria miniata]|uniref:CWH43-like N-terminal domain-containing protein n=1 Tax=Patiria miniata TaxID=46514 RepID=A0A913ZP33_PATMI|nr:DNA damage-regulated autophagy modulator protein 2-like [Patiria miniata]
MFIPGLRSFPYGCLPLAAGGCLLVGLVVPYIIAVRLGHVYPILPFISDTGALHPENCVFGQMLNLTSFFLVFIVYIRHKQVTQEGPTELLEFNKASTLLGYTAALFISLVGNVQIDVNSQHAIETEVHLFSAFMAFGGGLLFSLTQSWITYKLADDFWSYSMAALRFTLTFAGVVFSVTLLEFRELANAEFNGTYAQTLHWNPHDGGYVNHVYSSVSEYMMGFILTALVLSLYKEFSAIKPPTGDKNNPVAKVAAKGDIEIARDSLVSSL